MNSSEEKAASFSMLRARIPPLPPGEGWGEGKPCDELFSGKGCAVFHATGPDIPLSLRERAGVRVSRAMNSSVEKATPFSTLQARIPPSPSGRGLG